MANVATQTNPLVTLRMASGTFIEDSSAVAFTVTVGFKARYVEVTNEDDRTSMRWYEGMADAEAIVTVANGTVTLVTSNGITVSARTVIIGLDTNVNVVSKNISWYCIG